MDDDETHVCDLKSFADLCACATNFERKYYLHVCVNNSNNQAKASPKKEKASTKASTKTSAKKSKSKSKSAEDKAPRKPGGFAKTEYKLSPILAQVTGEKELSRPQVVKKLWEYIKVMCVCVCRFNSLQVWFHLYVINICCSESDI
jgi:chromatin remodeling complex protein RSC6